MLFTYFISSCLKLFRLALLIAYLKTFYTIRYFQWSVTQINRLGPNQYLYLTKSQCALHVSFACQQWHRSPRITKKHSLPLDDRDRSKCSVSMKWNNHNFVPFSTDLHKSDKRKKTLKSGNALQYGKHCYDRKKHYLKSTRIIW